MVNHDRIIRSHNNMMSDIRTHKIGLIIRYILTKDYAIYLDNVSYIFI